MSLVDKFPSLRQGFSIHTYMVNAGANHEQEPSGKGGSMEISVDQITCRCQSNDVARRSTSLTLRTDGVSVGRSRAQSLLAEREQGIVENCIDRTRELKNWGGERRERGDKHP